MKNLLFLLIVSLFCESADCREDSILTQSAAQELSGQRTIISSDSLSKTGVTSKSVDDDSGSDPLEAGAGGKRFEDAKTGRWIKVSSEPFGAKVFKNDSLLGSTPFLFNDPGEEVNIGLRLGRFYDTTIIVGAGRAPSRIFLRPLSIDKEMGESLFLDPSDKDGLLPIYIAGSSAVISGAAAAFYKIKADRLYAEYKSKTDDQKLETIKRFDNISAISLVVSQISVAILSYLLLNR